MTEVIGTQGSTAGLVLLLRRVEGRIHDRLRPLLVAAGVSQDHWSILSVLLHDPGLGMSAIADLAVLPSATVTRHMDRLVELGLVVRRIDATDKRRVVAALSPRGQELAEGLRAAERAIEERVVGAAVGHGADREALRRALEALASRT